MLSNNNMLTTGGRSQRQRRSVRVNKPAYGFFITGSSIEAMNGVYVARHPPRVLADSDEPVAALYYEHEDGQWHLALNELPGAEEEEEEEEDDDLRYWRHPKEKKPTHEWLFTDELGKGRFVHDGDTIIPGAGVRWKHVHRTEPTSTTSNTTASSSTAVTVSEEDDEDELPWQVIAILDTETVQDLLWSSQCRKEKVKAAKAGKTAKPPASTSLEGAFTPGAWLFRVKTVDGVTLYKSPDQGASEAGKREYGEYLKGIELSKCGQWLRLDKSEDTEGSNRWFMSDESDDEEEYYFSNQRKRNQYYNHSYSRRELWTKVYEEGGWSGKFDLLEEVKADDTAVMGLQGVGESDSLVENGVDENSENSSAAGSLALGYTGDYFDKPFVPRMEDGESSKNVGNVETLVDDTNTLTESLEKTAEEGQLRNEGADTQAPLGSAVTVSGLKSRSGRQYNQVSGVVIQAMDKATGRVGVRLEAPFSGHVVSCKPGNLVFRMDEEDDLNGDSCHDSEHAAVQRAARVLGLTPMQLGIALNGTASEDQGEMGDKSSDKLGLPWGFGGITASQRVGTALRCFLRLEGDLGITGNYGDGDPGRDAARILLENVNSHGDREMAFPTDVACSPAHMLIHGALGAEIAAIVSAAMDPFSATVRDSGLKALQKSAVSEKMRVRRREDALFVMEGEANLGEDSKGGDELLLRLALIQALLEGRREAEALEESKSIVKFEADTVLTDSSDSCAVVSYLLGCCLLRLGMRAPGLTALENATIVSMPYELQWLSPIQEWGAREAKKLLEVHQASEKCKTAAIEHYSRGSFEEAAAMYGRAVKLLEIGFVEDKRGRAMCFADKAGCLRRARKLDAAVEDLDNALRLFPRFTRALFRRAACLLEAGHANEAVEGFKALYRVDRDWPHLNEWLVRAYTLRKRQSRGDYKSSEADYQQYDDPRNEGNQGQQSQNSNSVYGEADRIAKEVDHYAVLGVTSDATEKQLKSAYRVRSLKFHPDKKGGHTAAFQRIAEAYHTLADPDKRQAYDEGDDIKVKRGRRDEDDDSDDSTEEHKTTMREEVEREFYPEKYHFWPFGDPFIYKRKREAQKRKKEGRQGWEENNPWA